MWSEWSIGGKSPGIGWPAAVVAAIALFLGVLIAPATTACASESGTSTYMPGFYDLRAGILPPPGFYLRNYLLFYEGRAAEVVESGVVQAHARLNLLADVLGATCVTPFRVLGANWAVGLRMPFPDMDLQASVITPFSRPEMSYHNTGLGDIVLSPMILGWHSGNFHWIVSGPTVYSPSGSYSLSDMINPGKNRWAFQGDVNFTWLDKERGHEISVATGYTTNLENPATHYRSGDEFHLDYAIAQHFPCGVSAALAGFYFQQVTPDSGSGALLGSFEGNTVGLGPLISYNFKLAGHPFTATFKYYRELEVENRFEGDWFWFNLSTRLF